MRRGSSDASEATPTRRLPRSRRRDACRGRRAPLFLEEAPPWPRFLEIDTEEACDRREEELASPDCRRISLDMTPLSCKSTGSSAECAVGAESGRWARYHHSDQTIIILDWDDTVPSCPTGMCYVSEATRRAS